MAEHNYYLWVEIEANKPRLVDARRFENILSKCQDAGIGSIVLSVKDTTGFGIYNSDIVPHYSEFDGDFAKKNYLELYITAAHNRGLKLYAGIDVFSEGRNADKNEKSPAIVHPDWQTQFYGISDAGTARIRKVSELGNLKTTGSIDDFNEIFVNPANDEVQNYEVSIINELITHYDIDGIVLDRVRFVGLASDFGDCTRKKFELFTNRKVEHWPEDIYKLENDSGSIAASYGSRFGEWVEFRASVIKNFILKVRETVDKADKKVEFIDYTGSWYPLYYLVGANWASEGYIAEEYKWVNKISYSKTGYAQDIDKLMSGFYYPEVTVEEAKKNGRPDYWYSVEGSAKMADKVTMGAVPIIGSLFLQQYEGNPEQFQKAVKMCFNKSAGCMLFDLSYVDGYDWWNKCRI